jgi:arsenate reductase
MPVSEVTIYHNPRCSKSRQTLALLEERGIEPNIVLYLEQPPSADQLRTLLTQLGIGARDLARTKESIYAELDLEGASDDDLITAMTTHPILIERPIVQVNGKAALGRPPEQVISIL